MRNAGGIFRNAAVIDERCHPLGVLEARRAKYQPRGFEDCDTSHLGVDPATIKQRHWSVPYALEKQEGSRLAVSPNLEPSGSTGSTGAPADLGLIHRLFGRSLHRCDGDVGAAPSLRTVRHAAVDQRKQRVIPAQADVLARMRFGSVLPHNDIARPTRLAAEQLDAEALARGIAAVTRGAACFLVRHGGLPSRTSAD